VNSRLLRQIIKAIVISIFGKKQCVVSVALLNTEEISRINTAFLKHDGSTDVITFDYSEGSLCGEILICVDEAIRQAQVFRTTWQSELVRYLIHGFLHLDGYEDLVAADRRKMKREEDRILEQVARKFDLSKL
jgi:probable rRNA maturation factor